MYRQQTYDKIKEQVNENSIDVVKNKFEEKDKKVLQDGTIASGNTNVIHVQQNPVNNTQNVGSTGMITQGNSANADKGSVYEKLSDFVIFTNSSSVRILNFLVKSQKP